MPTYNYEHEGEGCRLGKCFLVEQSIHESALEKCPECGQEVYRVISPTYISTPTTDTDLKDKGFAKLVKRDKGVYENVTALDGESKIWDSRDPSTMPNIKKRISD
jgi:predicted nucleic acid-binding Zn ribbon protein